MTLATPEDSRDDSNPTRRPAPIENASDENGSTGAPWCARAYCGPAHGQSWPPVPTAGPPPMVELSAGGRRVRYRLVHHPRTRAPATDHLGNYLYMPVRYGFDT